MSDTLQEYVDWRGLGLRIDRVAGVIHGVKILGLQSRNGRTYLPEALQAAVDLYENAKVNVNHPKGGPVSPRDYQDRLGSIQRVAFREDGLYGDLHFNPRHALAEQLLWDAEHAPQNVGFSHNVEARLARRGDQSVVEAITRVQSVDLVADPATTRGLFESAHKPVVDALTLAELRLHRPDLVEALLADQRDALAQRTARETLARRILAEHHLPAPESTEAEGRLLVDAAFFAALVEAADEAEMRKLAGQRAQLWEAVRRGAMCGGGSRPTARAQQAELIDDRAAFLAAIVA